jgi:hypothetical protein
MGVGERDHGSRSRLDLVEHVPQRRVGGCQPGRHRDGGELVEELLSVRPPRDADTTAQIKMGSVRIATLLRSWTRILRRLNMVLVGALSPRPG